MVKVLPLVKGNGPESYENNKLMPSQGGENRIIVRDVLVESLFGALQELR